MTNVSRNYINGIQNDFENHWQRVSTTAESSIKKELEAYWTGYRDEETWDEAADELIASGAFVEFNTAVSGVVKELTGKWFTAISIGLLWCVTFRILDLRKILLKSPFKLTKVGLSRNFT